MVLPVHSNPISAYPGGSSVAPSQWNRGGHGRPVMSSCLCAWIICAGRISPGQRLTALTTESQDRRFSEFYAKICCQTASLRKSASPTTHDSCHSVNVGEGAIDGRWSSWPNGRPTTSAGGDAISSISANAFRMYQQSISTDPKFQRRRQLRSNLTLSDHRLSAGCGQLHHLISNCLPALQRSLPCVAPRGQHEPWIPLGGLLLAG